MTDHPTPQDADGLSRYTITQTDMDRLHGAAHSGAMLGGDSAYEGCLNVESILAEIATRTTPSPTHEAAEGAGDGTRLVGGIVAFEVVSDDLNSMAGFTRDEGVADIWRHGGLTVRPLYAAPPKPAPDPPGHTDLMVTPESIPGFMEKNPLPAQDVRREELIEKEARRRGIASGMTSPWWKVHFDPIIRSEIEKLEKAGFTVSVAAGAGEQIRWQRVNDEPFEYAIRQGPHGDEFVRTSDASCLRRPLSPPAGAAEPGTNENEDVDLCPGGYWRGSDACRTCACIALPPAVPTEPVARCPHDMGLDNELGPLGCRLVGQELQCVCEHMHFAALPPVRAERETLAETIHKARYRSDRTPQPFANEDQHGREYCYRLADAILSLPVQSGAGECPGCGKIEADSSHADGCPVVRQGPDSGVGEREAELLRSAARMRDMLTADGDPPSLLIPNDIIDSDDVNEFTQAFDELATAIRAYRQPPHSGDGGGR